MWKDDKYKTKATVVELPYMYVQTPQKRICIDTVTNTMGSKKNDSGANRLSAGHLN